MEKIEIHFFHGFLGEPADWMGVAERIPKNESIEMHFHSLVEIFQSLEDDQSLAMAAKKVQSQLEKTNSTKVLVGYSLGGRVILHLDPKVYSKMLLLGVHPGLETNHAERLQKDEDWASKSGVSLNDGESNDQSSKKVGSQVERSLEKSTHRKKSKKNSGEEESSQEESSQDNDPQENWYKEQWSLKIWPLIKWIDEWNRQPVFAKDQVRPTRNLTEDTFAIYMQILVSWSLGKQKDLKGGLSSNAKNIFWACGEKDEKFCLLGNQLKQILPQDHVMIVPDAGHGILFDQPKYVSQLIAKVLNHVR